MAKLDPDNAKSAKDVMEDRAAAALKRKREEDGEENRDGPTEKQREGLKLHDLKKRKTDRNSKLEKTADANLEEPSTEDRKRKKAEKNLANKKRKQAEKVKAQQKAERRKARKEAAKCGSDTKEEGVGKDQDGSAEDDEDINVTIDTDSKDIAIINERHSTASPSPGITSPIESPRLHSGSSSISSINPPSVSPPVQSSQLKSTDSTLPSLLSEAADSPALTPQQRLEARINALRAQRKADGPDGHQPRNRQELLESRRRQEEKRRAHKKELLRKAKEAEIRKQEEAIVKRFSPGGSGSLITAPRSPMEPTNNFSFGRVAFADGTQADSSLSSLLNPPHKRGPSDAGTALKAAQNKASRLAGLDEAKRADILQKDMWLNAKKKAHGERVRDDTNLLKKTLKRQDGEKKKSEREWRGRIEGVAKSQEVRQKKREANIEKRREEKGGGGGGKHVHKKGGVKKAKVKRPGFEGSFKTRNTGGKR